jgi:methyl-accepting chemotaxis protein
MQITMVVLFILIMVPLLLIIYFTLERDTYQRSRSELNNTTELIKSNINLYTQSSVENHLRSTAVKTRDLMAYYYSLYKKGEMSENEAYSRIKRVILDPDYGKIGTTGYLAGISGEGILSIHPRSEGVDASGFDFMKEATAMKNGYLEYMWKNSGEDVERQKAGYLSEFAPWDIIVWASSYTSEFSFLIDIEVLKDTLKDIKIGEKGYPIVTDREGEIIFHPELAGGNLFKEGSSSFYSAELGVLAKSLLSAEKESSENLISSYTGEIDKVKRMVCVGYIEEMDWFIFTSLPENEIYSIVDRIGRIFLFALILAFFVMNFVIFVGFRWLLLPLKEITSVANAVQGGDISRVTDVASQDELGTIAGQINDMIGTICSMVSRMKDDVTTLNNSVQELGSSSGEISTTSNEQASAVKEIVSTMEDSDKLTKSIEKKIAEVAQISDHSRTIVVKGVNNVEESLVKMEEIRVSNHDTITGIRSLSEKIEAIWEIVTIINSIADQTKIIAFNAELEASAAGDAGKNFQIVASEIRRLANSTVNSTSEIKNKINEIQHSSDRLITASEDGTNKIAEGGRLTEMLHTTFEEILETTEISADSANDISSSIKQQVMAFEQILLTLKQISEGINSFVISTKSTSEITQKLQIMSNTMRDFLDSYKTENQENINEEEDPI